VRLLEKFWVGPTTDMRIAYVSIFAVLLLLAGSLCPALPETPALSCHGTQQPRQVAELLFGRDIGRHLGVGESAWTLFVAREITPRFPDGLTITNALGQWRDSDTGKTVHEPSKRVEIVLPGKDDDDTRLDAIAAAYKRQFHQQSVAIIVRSACVSF